MTTISVETERMMPRSIRKERILWARRVSRATPIGDPARPQNALFPDASGRAGSPGLRRSVRGARPGASCVRFPCPFYAQESEKVSRREAKSRQSLVLLGKLYHYHWRP